MPKATLIYQGVDITQDVDMVECVHTDVSGGACDCLSIKLDHAEKWFGWGPEKNDTIQILRNGYDTGTLYLNTVAPEAEVSCTSPFISFRYSTLTGTT